MQTTLLGLAIAVILALVAALVAPLVVDWNHYRFAFEQEGSRLIGLQVHVQGPIEARILPSPHMVLRDIAIGDAAAPRLRADAVELEVGLGPLLRGEVQATELRLVAPQITMGLDASGAFDWPAFPAVHGADSLAVSRLDVENGRIILSDAASGWRQPLQRLSFHGDIHSLRGSFGGEGTFDAGGEPFAFHLSGGRVGDERAVKLRLGIEPKNRPLSTEIDGALSFADGVPQFSGTLGVVRPAAATLADGKRVLSNPWQLSGKLHATPAAAKLENLVLQYGPEERAATLNGQADVSFGAKPHLDGSVSAAQIDVDRMLAAPDLTHRPPLIMFKSLLEGVAGTATPPMPVNVGVAIESVTVGGAALQSLRGRLRFDDDAGWSLDELALRAPGLTAINISGRLGAGAQGFTLHGPASVETTDLKMLVAWLEGRSDRPAGAAESMSAHGDITIANDRFAIDRVTAVMDQDKIDGRLAYTWPTEDRAATLDAEVRAPRLDLDALAAFAKAAVTDGGFDMPRQVALAVNVGQATFVGSDARDIDARLTLASGILHVDRLSIGDIGGAALEVSGHIDELSSRPRGQLTLDLNAATLAGVSKIAGHYVPAANALAGMVTRLAPAKVRGVLTIDRAKAPADAASVARFDLTGNLGALRLALNGDATGMPTQAEAALLRVNGRLDADDGGALVGLLGLDRVLAVDQLPGQLTLTAAGPLNGDLRVNAMAAAGGFSATADGTMHLHEGGAPTGSLQLSASAADLRPLYRSMTGQSGGGTPIRVGAIVGIAGPDITVSDLALRAGQSSLRGRLDLKVANPVTVDGELAGDDVDARALATLLLGLPRGAAAAPTWSAAPIGPGAFGAVSGAVRFAFDRATLTPALSARDLTGVVRAQPPEIAFDDVDAKLGGGRLTANLSFRRDPQSLSGRGRLALTDANAAALLPDAGVDGPLTLRLEGESQGLSPEGLVGALHAGGTLALAQGQIAGISTAAFNAAIHSADQNGTVDTEKVRTVVSAAMDNGKLAVGKGEAEVTVTAGQVRLANTALPAPDGAQLSLDGVFDLKSAALDAHMTLSAPPSVNNFVPARPELAITVKGPLAAPERKFDLSALLGWLTLRATEQQTRRLEAVEANRRAEVSGEAMHPPSPAMRFVPQGAVVEIANQGAAALPGGGFDRLRPETPPGPPAAAPSAVKPAAASADRNTAAAASPGPTSAAQGGGQTPVQGAAQGLRSFFNSLFGSQN